MDNLLLLNAVLFVAKGGISWRNLPTRFGNWNTVYVRFRRWAKAGMWQRLFEHFTNKEMKALLINSTIVRAHQHPAGAKKRISKEMKPLVEAGWANNEAACELR